MTMKHETLRKDPTGGTPVTRGGMGEQPPQPVGHRPVDSGNNYLIYSLKKMFSEFNFARWATADSGLGAVGRILI